MNELNQETSMPRIRTEDRVQTAEYKAVLYSSTTALCDANNCAVVAVCIATNEPYDKVHAMFAAKGRKNRRGVNTAIIEEVMNELGYDLVVQPRKKFIDLYPAPHCNVLRSVTTHHPARFNKVWADGKTYLFSVTGHILAVVNGVNHDWTKGKAKRVRLVYEVVKRTAIEDAATKAVQAFSSTFVKHI